MELHNLKPAEGSIKSRKRVGRGEGSKEEGLLQEDIKALNHVQDIQRKLDLREGNNHYKEESLSLDLRIQIE